MRKRPSDVFPVPAERLLVVGDIMCDHYVWGDVERISPEAPVQVLCWEREEHRAGGAANAALNLASLGCNVHLIGIVGNDEPGRWLLETLGRAGVDTHGIVVSSNRPTALKTRIIARGQHILRIDRETPGPVETGEEGRMARAIEGLTGVGAVVCSDYAKGVLSGRVLSSSLAAARDAFVLVDPKGRDFSKYRGAHLLTPNEKELMEAAGDADRRNTDDDVVTTRAGKMMRSLDLKALLVTRGARGMDLFERHERLVRRNEIAALQRHEVFDVTGAGDTVAAVLAMGVAGGLPLPEAAALANAAAGIVVGLVGTAVVDPEVLRRTLTERPADSAKSARRSPRSRDT